jgi:hypothetical protein
VTRRLRSLLCRRCNSALGLLRHNSTLLREGGAYVDVWAAIHAAEGEFQPAVTIRARPRPARPERAVAPPPPADAPALKAQENAPEKARSRPPADAAASPATPTSARFLPAVWALALGLDPKPE